MTPKSKAKEVKVYKWNKRARYMAQQWSHFETEDGRKFGYACNWNWKYGYDYNEKTKFYVCKYSGEPRSEEYRYRIYEIPYHQAIKEWYPGYKSMIHINDGFFVIPKN